MEEDLEEIIKDWSTDLLIPANPVEMFDPDIPETTHKEHDTLGPNRTKKTEEVKDLSNALGKICSVSPNRGGDDEVEQINGKGDE
jgi:hypothetical protein